MCLLALSPCVLTQKYLHVVSTSASAFGPLITSLQLAVHLRLSFDRLGVERIHFISVGRQHFAIFLVEFVAILNADLEQYCCTKRTQAYRLIQFLPRDAMRIRRICCRPVSICPSVRHIGVLYPDG